MSILVQYLNRKKSLFFLNGKFQLISNFCLQMWFGRAHRAYHRRGQRSGSGADQGTLQKRSQNHHGSQGGLRINGVMSINVIRIKDTYLQSEAVLI